MNLLQVNYKSMAVAVPTNQTLDNYSIPYFDKSVVSLPLSSFLQMKQKLRQKQRIQIWI